MLLKKKITPLWYVISDFLMTALAWAVFFFIRKQFLHQPSTDQALWLGCLLVPAGWLILYTLTGSYYSVYKKSRLAEFTKTLICTIIGTVILFFFFLLNDRNDTYNYY